MTKHESGKTTQHETAKSVQRTVSDQRAIQSRIDRKDAKKPPAKKSAEEKKEPVQAGVRTQPEPPQPAQHLRKPGMESELALKPRYQAPEYRGSGKLEGMAALVTGGDSGIGRAVAVLFAREGADVAIAYLSEHEDARGDTPAGREGRAAMRRHLRRRQGRAVLRTGRGAGGEGFREARHPGQQRRIPGAQPQPGGHHRRAPAGNPADQHRRLLPHGARRAAVHRARRDRSSTPVRKPACSATRTCWTTPRPRARSTPSPSRWPATCSSAASASMPWRPGRYGRR